MHLAPKIDSDMFSVTVKIEAERDIAEHKAIVSLSRYKFQQFGYWAAIWVHLNRLCERRKANPFGEFVALARQRQNLRRKGVD
jgi:hypothetical protein